VSLRWKGRRWEEIVKKKRKKRPTTLRFHTVSLAIGWDGSVDNV
jgi:hypothetical protein